MNCSNCQTEIAAEAKFCSQCGSAVQHVESKGENKFLTVAFSDITSYTTVSERLDPEEVQHLLADFHSRVHQIAPRYGGVVHEIIGDCVVLLFGEPQAKEDDAIRAIQAVRELHDAVSGLSTQEFEQTMGFKLTLHSGINTGTVLVTQDNIRGLRQIVGDVVNTAARLDSLAQANEIIVGRATWELSRAQFEFEQLAPAKLKGKEGMQEVFKYRADAGSQKESSNTAITRRLIGRGLEMEQFQATVLDLDDGKPTLLTVTAEAGGGKSRLVSEWVETFGGKLRFHLAKCNSMMLHSRYGMWSDFAHAFLEIDHDSSPARKSEKIRQRFHEFGLDASMIKYTHNILQLDHPDLADEDPIVLKQATASAAAMLLNFLAKQGPTVFVFEDLHWADQLSLELLDEALHQVSTNAIWVCTYRSSFDWPALHAVKKRSTLRHRPLPIQPLSKRDGEALLQSILETSEVPTQLSQYIHNRVQGNPFYIEEFVRSLIDSNQLVRNGRWKLTTDLEDQKVPTSIRGIVRSRLDHLDTPEKRLLQQASVIGRSFPYHVIEKINGADGNVKSHLARLRHSDILLEQRTDSSEDFEYSFRHALMQEITYQSMLKKDRSQIHAKVGSIMEELFEERLTEFHEVLAFHFTEGRDVEKAIKYLVLAGNKKCQDLATQEAHSLFEKAYELLWTGDFAQEKEDLLLLDILIGWSFVHYYSARSAEQYKLLLRHHEVAERCPDLRRKAWYYGWLSNADVTGNIGSPETMRIAQQAIDYAEQCADHRLRGYVYAWYSTAAMCIEGTQKGEAYALEAVQISRRYANDHYLAAKARLGAVWCLMMNGKFQTARRYADECIELGHQKCSPRMVALGSYGSAMLQLAQGQMGESVERYLEAGRSSADALYGCLSYTQGASILALERRDDESRDVLKQVPKHDSDIGRLFERLAGGALMLNGGRMKEGFDMIQSELTRVHDIGAFGIYGLLQCVMGTTFIDMIKEPVTPPVTVLVKNLRFIVSFLPKLPSRTAKLFNGLIVFGEEHGFPGLTAIAYYHLGRLYAIRKKSSLAREYFTAAIAAMEQLEMPDELASAREQLATLND
ncbi:MAG: AAA family ATPase [Saprospiraceae bacterium]|nr:AAA family ATPase [Saprospiraceae bacterium]